MDQRTNQLETERTAGIIVYRKSKLGIRFLLLYHGGDYWNFPKGHLEARESPHTAAVRETTEETGLTKRDFNFHYQFQGYDSFTIKRGGKKKIKTIVYFLAETRNPIIKISREHYGYGWFLYKDALKIIKYKNQADNLKRAYAILLNPEKRIRPPTIKK